MFRIGWEMFSNKKIAFVGDGIVDDDVALVSKYVRRRSESIIKS